jgi:hypothetical protein
MPHGPRVQVSHRQLRSDESYVSGMKISRQLAFGMKTPIVILQSVNEFVAGKRVFSEGAVVLFMLQRQLRSTSYTSCMTGVSVSLSNSSISVPWTQASYIAGSWRDPALGITLERFSLRVSSLTCIQGKYWGLSWHCRVPFPEWHGFGDHEVNNRGTLKHSYRTIASQVFLSSSFLRIDPLPDAGCWFRSQETATSIMILTRAEVPSSTSGALYVSEPNRNSTSCRIV